MPDPNESQKYGDGEYRQGLWFLVQLVMEVQVW